MILWSPSVAAPSEGVVRARAWVRGDCASCWLRFRYNFADVGLSVHFSPNPDGWQEIVTGPLGLWGPLHELRASLTCTSRNNSVLDVFVDSIQIEAGPTTPWHPGPAPRAGESVSAPLPAGPWTHILTLQPEAFSDYVYDDEQFLIGSYTTAAGDAATLFFGPLDRRFKLRTQRVGHPPQYLETPPQRFQRLAQFRIAVRSAPEGMRLAILNGQPLAHASTATPAIFPDSAVTWTTGGAAGQHLMPAIWLDSSVIPAALSDEDLQKALFPPQLPANWQAESITIERRPPGGTWQTLVVLPASPAEFTDPTGLPGETWEYRAIGENHEWWSAPSAPIVVTRARAGDLNGDNVVDLSDLAAFLAAFGLTQNEPGFTIDADFTGDDIIDLADLALLLTEFGT
jgi:hypothetical protein